MHLDGAIDSKNFKLEEYKKRQHEITSEMTTHINADEACLATAKTVLNLAKQEKKLMNANLDKKTGTFEFQIER